MRKFILILLIACLSLNKISAQIQTGDLKKDDLASFRKTTTIFIVQPGDKDRIQDFEKSISEVWTITPFKVITPDAQNAYRGRNYSLFQISAGIHHHKPNQAHQPPAQLRDFSKSNSGTSLDYKTASFTYELSIPDFNKEGEMEGRTLIAELGLSADVETIKELIKVSPGERKAFEGNAARAEREKKQLAILYNSARFNNWGPGQIRGYLKAINDQLVAGKKRTLFFTTVPDKEKLKSLGSDTLYLPNYLKDRVNPYTRTERSVEDDEAEVDVAKAYPFPYRYIDEEELDKMLVYSSKPVHHLVYVRTVAVKHIAVVEGRSAATLYSVQQQMSYNFKMKDLKKLAEQMR